MKNNKRMILSIFWVVLGAVLLVLGIAERIDEYWSSMGSALMVVGIFQLVRFNRLAKNEEYRKRMEVATTDERNAYIRSKAWAWTGYIFVLTAAVLVIVLKIAGQDLLSWAASMAVCFVLVVYWVAYMILQKKY